MVKKGEVTNFPGMSMTCGGKYFDWPLWKRLPSRVLKGPYSNVMATWYTIKRMRHWPWGWHRHDGSQCVDLSTYWSVMKSLALSRIYPVFWQWDGKMEEEPDGP